jgi:hypothetical protein
MNDSSAITTWKRQVDALMKRDYAIDTDDAGLGEEDIARFFADGDTPEEFVNWFAEKYDLNRCDSYFPAPRPPR